MKDSRIEPKLVGVADFSTEELLYEDCVGRINFPKNIGQCKIFVYSNEGKIPHFHIISKKGNEECCVCIYQPLYFNHGNKQLQLNSKQRKILNEWLQSPSEIVSGATNWGVLSGFWIGGNGKDNVPEKLVQPNYNDLKNMRN